MPDFWTKTLIPTLRQAPGDAEVPSHQLMLRAGLIHKLGSGSYSYLPLGLRSLNKVTKIIRQEMHAAGERGGFEAIFPPMDRCTDNAVMIAAAGTRLLERGVRDDLSLEAFSRVPIGEAPWRDPARANA